ncbi:type II secretion system protein GspD [Pseudolysobacter antarcticus]|uniref:Type II secretion system protein GspD n=1 Tax=Pseudolysobacter antarcticus TaxID=2511995 RepID=A0A411HMT5_9GAMM|nr:type II secretion system secretin GspD [Pseudolysobacter antarcticus]QBB71795.1 type II secretion system protein GspD [Pseudolysobacter antarcticus]
MSLRLRITIIALLTALAAGCATPGQHKDSAPAGEDSIIRTMAPVGSDAERKQRELDETSTGIAIGSKGKDPSKPPAKGEVELGTGKFINEQAAKALTPKAAADGQITFNFDNTPIQAVVQNILGELLKRNYTIAPGVQGNVTFSTAKPINLDQAMSILEMLLSWTKNSLVFKDGRYIVTAVADAIPGNLAPTISAPTLPNGYSVRVFPLKYVSPTEMAKILKPYARADAVVSADAARSMMVLAGNQGELENYARVIQIFDVDWLKGMSVGVYALQHAEVAKIMTEMDKIFGATGESPLAGMFRFIPIDSTNSVVVITPQVTYLEQAEKWLHRLDVGAGDSATQLYVYDVKNVKAVDLSDHLISIFIGGSSSSGARRTSTSGSVAPGLRSSSIGGAGGGIGGSTLGGSSLGGGVGGATTGLNQARTNNLPTNAGANGGSAPAASGGAAAKDSDIRITAVEENNQLLIMATPFEWDSITSAIRRLDVPPLQVQIEAKVLEVILSGDLNYGVQWYLNGLIGTGAGSAEANGNYNYNPPGVNNGRDFTGNSHDRHRTSLGATTAGPGPVANGGLFYSFLNKNFEVAINALQTKGLTKALATPSLVVMNNQSATIMSGSQIPITTVSLAPGVIGTTGTGTSTTSSSYNSVNYISTGTTLTITPRVNPGGLVYMDIQQEVSSPAQAAPGANPAINQRQLQTQVAVQSGETVLLGGLIQENNSTVETGLPGLVNIPIIGKLFGNTTNHRDRTELIILITPRVIRNQEEARTMTEEYQNKFESLAPLRAKGTVLAPPVPTSSPDAPIKNTNGSDKGFVPAETVPMPNPDKQH